MSVSSESHAPNNGFPPYRFRVFCYKRWMNRYAYHVLACVTLHERKSTMTAHPDQCTSSRNTLLKHRFVCVCVRASVCVWSRSSSLKLCILVHACVCMNVNMLAECCTVIYDRIAIYFPQNDHIHMWNHAWTAYRKVLPIRGIIPEGTTCSYPKMEHPIICSCKGLQQIFNAFWDHDTKHQRLQREKRWEWACYSRTRILNWGCAWSCTRVLY